MCFPEGGYASEGSEKEAFQKCVNLDAQKQQVGLASGRDTPLTREAVPLRHDCPPCPARLGIYGQINV